MNFSYRNDKGVAGLTVLLSMIVMLFTMGFLIMIFTIMGGELQTEAKISESGTQTNEQVTITTATTFDLAKRGLEEYSCGTLTIVNATSNTAITGGNYTEGDCQVTVLNVPYIINTTVWNVTYTYSGLENSTASGVIEDTSGSLSDTIDWFGIIIVMGAMVVLILLTVIIITALKSAGVVASGVGGKADASIRSA